MTHIDDLLVRNRDFARTDQKSRVPEIPFIPTMQTYVVTCVDPRVDPAQVLGLDLGDAIVERNVGGRVTPAVIQDVAWISYLHEIKTPDAEWFELAVIHHSDCGSGLFADNELRQGFAARGFDEPALAELPVLAPAETVKVDVTKLLTAPQISSEIAVSGYWYDLGTGLLTEVVAPRHAPSRRLDADRA
jgi:carbonic anhydrase